MKKIMFTLTKRDHNIQRAKLARHSCRNLSCEGCWNCRRAEDVFHLLHHWDRELGLLQSQWDQGKPITLGLCKTTLSAHDKEPVAFWANSRDRFIASLATRKLYELFTHQRSPHYYSNPGAERIAAVREVSRKAAEYPYCYRTDIASYYASIDPTLQYENLKHDLEQIQDRHPQLSTRTSLNSLVQLVRQMLFPHLERPDGSIDSYSELNLSPQEREPYSYRPQGSLRRRGGIPRGLSSSPFIAWYALSDIDRAFAPLAKSGIFYQRYCDDIVLLAKSESALMRAKVYLQKLIRQKGYKLRRGKTYEGPATAGIVYLGFIIRPVGSRVEYDLSETSARKFRENLKRRERRDWPKYLRQWRRAYFLVHQARLDELINRNVQRVNLELLAAGVEPGTPTPRASRAPNPPLKEWDAARKPSVPAPIAGPQGRPEITGIAAAPTHEFRQRQPKPKAGSPPIASARAFLNVMMILPIVFGPPQLLPNPATVRPHPRAPPVFCQQI